MRTTRFSALAVLLAACSQPVLPRERDPFARPATQCRTGAAWTSERKAFNGSAENDALWGLGDVRGSNLGVADLDNDGYPDLVAIKSATNTRSDPDASPPVFYTRVLMNRPRESGSGRRFVDATRESGFLASRDGTFGRFTSMVAFGDVDNDGDQDAYAVPYVTVSPSAPDDPGDRHEVLLNDGAGHFTLAPESVATRTPYDFPQTLGIATLDQDRDGVLDLFVGYSYDPDANLEIGQQPNLFRGAGDGTFTDVTQSVGLQLGRTMADFAQARQIRPLYGASACDVNGDGALDLLGAAYGRQWNELFVSGASGFTDVSRASNVAGDDNVDYTQDQSFWCWCRSNPTACTATVPEPQYSCPLRGWRTGYNDQPWRLNGNTFTIACGDVDNDGDVDLYTAEIAHPDTGVASDRSQLLRNVSTGSTVQFRREDRTNSGLLPRSRATQDEGGISAAMLDFDHDGRLDIWLGASDYPGQYGWLFHQKADGKFEEVGTAAGFHHACPHGVAIADFDLDGDTDFIVGTSLARDCNTTWRGEAVVRIYESTLSDVNWTSVRLVGGGRGAANRTAVGARVRITAGGVTQTRWVQTTWGNMAQNAEPVVHAGVASACAIERIEVLWPDRAGTVETFTDIPANHRLEIRQGEGRVRYLD